ncbi:DUF551 domain-containing protein [Salmonella enterica subsp. enterica serovar Muenchen]|nr:DUF551 domain-containing protein [Salmonella enterica subsp. enterica serovar Muenchen]EHQ0640100.1 DUF551 domain-containing protein [Salmonella enterica subsp. enterica serovar Muenchen]EIJ4894210.1 DUF551 domain-containing protein [Salmonella enterica subsp. enterica serovar Muenchen]EJF4001028.1 DUF551 domain-containing protein [Salmonella enterica subsp. enterica serovar Muenchen]ELY1302679.1 DUF551 domain-containing protein [Salmonella enterica subsp. enterica serovar Muenchen]
MDKFTKEQQVQAVYDLKVGYTLGHADIAMLKSMARQLLASMEQEPVAWLLSGGGAKNDVRFDSSNAYADPLREVTPLYAAPQLPQLAVAITQHFDTIALDTAKMVMCDVNRRDEFLGGDIQLLSRIQCRIDEACRAAMLQAEPVSNSDELPLDYLQGHKDGLEWAAQLAEANHPQTGDWLYDDPIELARAIRKGPDIPEFKSVSVDEDDNFYSWFGRFWYENYQKNNYTTSAKQMLGTMAEFAYRAGRESAALAGNSPVIGIDLASEPDRSVEVRYLAPPGYVMVPRVATEKMLIAGLEEANPLGALIDWDASRGDCNTRKQVQEIFKAMLAAAPQPQNEPQNIPEIIPQWIPVSDRMPYVGKKLALYGRRAKEDCAHYVDEGYLGSNGFFYFFDWEGGPRIDDCHNDDKATVTHWMYWELPAAPHQEVKNV